MMMTQDDAATATGAGWTREALLDLLEMPLIPLLDRARAVHLAHHDPGDVQQARLLSIKTGACPEDCAYCPQSAHFAKRTGLAREPLMEVAPVLEAARAAREEGASRFCMGAAWREVKDGPAFDAVCAMVAGVAALGMEPCVTLGMIEPHQAARLRDAGLKAYNHNIDTSPDFYPEIISTRSFEDRLRTLEAVRAAGVEICSGVILGMGETLADRARALEVLANLDPQPESVPINTLVAVPGTPLEDRPPVEALELVRMVAATRIAIPKARVRLSAGRRRLSYSDQLLCFLAGANSIFHGEKLLTTANNDALDDDRMMALFGAGDPRGAPGSRPSRASAPAGERPPQVSG